MPNTPTARQLLFAAEYLKDLNATQAAIRAGYAVDTANREGSRLLSNVDIQAAIAELAAEREQRLRIDADFVLKELHALADFDMASVFNEDGSLKAIHDMPLLARKAISGFEVEELFEGRGDDRARVGVLKKVKLWSKDRALELLARHKSLLNDKVQHEHTGKDGEPLSIDDASLALRIDAIYASAARRKLEHDYADLV